MVYRSDLGSEVCRFESDLHYKKIDKFCEHGVIGNISAFQAEVPESLSGVHSNK